jgi:hypothetical protein
LKQGPTVGAVNSRGANPEPNGRRQVDAHHFEETRPRPRRGARRRHRWGTFGGLVVLPVDPRGRGGARAFEGLAGRDGCNVETSEGDGRRLKLNAACGGRARSSGGACPRGSAGGGPAAAANQSTRRHRVGGALLPAAFAEVKVASAAAVHDGVLRKLRAARVAAEPARGRLKSPKGVVARAAHGLGRRKSNSDGRCRGDHARRRCPGLQGCPRPFRMRECSTFP